MSFLSASTSFTRFRIIDPVPAELWPTLPAKLRQFAFRDIDDIAVERGFGWVNFDDMLDADWRLSPPEKAEFVTFSLRLDTRRIPPAVLKKHSRLAIMAEEARIKEQGKKFVGRERKKELTEQVKLRLMGRFLPIPAEFQVVWSPKTNIVLVASSQRKLLDLFMEHFTLTFDLHLEQLTPYGLAIALLGEDSAKRLDDLAPTRFL